MLIAVEGVIGVGKTSLVNILSEELSGNTIYETFEENPYLGKFYENKNDYSFPTEMFFLVSRHHQLKKDKYSSDELFISDYMIDKNLIFAQNTLSDTEYTKFTDVFNILTENSVKADVVIYLKAKTKTLKNRIKIRNRAIEKSITDDYLCNLTKSYDEYFQKNQNKFPIFLIIENDEIDYVNNVEDKKKILKIIKNALKEKSE